MNPIIDPSIWYVMQVADGVRAVCISFFFISILGIIMIKIWSNGYSKWNHVVGFVLCIVIMCACIFVGSFYPNSNTILKQEITKQITPGNIEMFKNEARSLVEYIIEKVRELK